MLNCQLRRPLGLTTPVDSVLLTAPNTTPPMFKKKEGGGFYYPTYNKNST